MMVLFKVIVLKCFKLVGKCYGILLFVFIILFFVIVVIIVIFILLFIKLFLLLNCGSILILVIKCVLV